MSHPQEPDVVPSRPIFAILALVVVVVIVGALTAWRMGRAAPTVPPVPDEVNAQETTVFRAAAAGREDHARSEQRLRSYGWVDRQGGIVHIPIDAAYELYLGRRGAR